MRHTVHALAVKSALINNETIYKISDYGEGMRVALIGEVEDIMVIDSRIELARYRSAMSRRVAMSRSEARLEAKRQLCLRFVRLFVSSMCAERVSNRHSSLVARPHRNLFFAVIALLT